MAAASDSGDVRLRSSSIGTLDVVFQSITYMAPGGPVSNPMDDAIRAFLQGNLDYLAIGDSLVEHPSSRR